MGNFDEHFRWTLTRQSWCFYGVGMVLISTRLYARAKKLGITNYQTDDYLMIFAAGLYTALITTLNAIANGGGSNLYPPSLAGTFTAEDIQTRIQGSKIVLVSEQAMLNVIYVLKTCMLIMFSRLTLGLARDQRLVLWLAYYVAAGWLASEITFFTACRPFTGYWALPPPDPQCTTLEHYAIVQGCFNISADVLMLGIPIPLIIRMRLPWRQKIVLIIVFSLGVFVIIAALMTKIFNLTDVYSPNYMLWYVREASVAVYVSNLPMIWPLLRKWFPCLRKLTPGVASPHEQYSNKHNINNNNNNKSIRGSRWMARATGGRRKSGGGDGGSTFRLGEDSGRYMSRKSTNTTRTTSHGGFGEHLLEAGSESVLLSPLSEAQIKGIKDPFDVAYHDIEMGTVTNLVHEVDNDNTNRRRSTSEKVVNHFTGVTSGNSSRRGSQGLGELLLSETEGRQAVYLDAPAKVVTKVDSGTRAARVQSAECQFVLVGSPATVSAREEEDESNNPFLQGASITKGEREREQEQEQTTVGVREEGVAASPTQRASSPRSEEPGIAW